MSGYKLGRMLMIVVLLTVASTSPAGAHCDALDGPVVTLAKKALETGNINPILSWVAKADEPEIRRAFERRLAFIGNPFTIRRDTDAPHQLS